MVKGGRESLRPCYGRPKLTLIKKKQVLKRHLNSVLKDLYRVSVKEDIKCEKCGKSFTRKDYLFMHEGTVHKIFNISFGALQKMLKYKGGFKCKLCGDQFHGKKAFFLVADMTAGKTCFCLFVLG